MSDALDPWLHTGVAPSLGWQKRQEGDGDRHRLLVWCPSPPCFAVGDKGRFLFLLGGAAVALPIVSWKQVLHCLDLLFTVCSFCLQVIVLLPILCLEHIMNMCTFDCGIFSNPLFVLTVEFLLKAYLMKFFILGYIMLLVTF